MELIDIYLIALAVLLVASLIRRARIDKKNEHLGRDVPPSNHEFPMPKNVVPPKTSSPRHPDSYTE